ncbi:hypothetical protein SPI_05784 [Niveomyces insectorum RCEF 264]|uniref:MARVEL domain-containing protein n=1 Tax=Niveomyces insectorum RCEF 264 TaxID=1081102 RepID=A0A167SFS5_9HYPO|nr:hypothetical protein SPI_05784 [Niveomyces insectorum RCEF 264]
MVNYQGSWTDPLAGDGRDRSHILVLPLWTAFLRIAQLLIALLMLILTAFSASKLGSGAAGFGLTWFTFILTLIYFGWLGASVYAFPAAYHPVAHLPAEILVNIFWLCSWAVLASEAASIGDLESLFGSGILRFLPTEYRNALNCVKAAAGIGALEWVLFCVTLGFLVAAFINQTRALGAGNAAEAGVGAGAGAGAAAAAGTVEPKPTEMQNYYYGSAPAPDGSVPPGGVPPVQQQAYAQPPQQQQPVPPQGYPQPGYPQQAYVDPQQQQQQQQPYPTQGYAAEAQQQQQQPVYQQSPPPPGPTPEAGAPTHPPA